MFKKVLFILPVFIALCISVCAESVSYDYASGKVENTGTYAIIKKDGKLYFSGEENSVRVDLEKGDKITLLKWASYESIKPEDDPYVYTTCAIDYMCEGKLIESGFSFLETEPKFPQLEERIGYEVKWSYNLQGENYIVANAEYALKIFVAEFVADGEVIDSQEYTIETTELVAPTIPEKSGHRAVWERYEIVPGGMVINARYISEETDAENAEELFHYSNLADDLKFHSQLGTQKQIVDNVVYVAEKIIEDINYGIIINENHIKEKFGGPDGIIKKTQALNATLSERKKTDLKRYIATTIKDATTYDYFLEFYEKYF